MSADEIAAGVWASVGREATRRGDSPGGAGRLQRVCRAAVVTLPATGVGVSVLAGDGTQVSAAASDETHEVIEELQLTMGEGPCLDAFTSRAPVLVPDLGVFARTRWPGYAPEALDHGVRAVFAFPLHVGAVHLGALDVYQDRAGALTTKAVSQAITFAEVAMRTLLDEGTGTGEPGGSDAERTDDRRALQIPDALAHRLELYQAQGMVMMQLGISLAQAMARLRAYAYAHDRPLHDVAADIVARRLVLVDDHV